MATKPTNVEIDLDSFDFDAVPTDQTENTNQVKRDVPASLIKLAQTAVDGNLRVTKTFRGQNQAFVTAFAEAMKFAGDHTTPQVTMKVLHEENSIVVTYYPTKRRGPGKKADNGSNDAE